MRRRLPDVLIIALLFLLPLVLFWQQTVGGRTLLPTENLFQYEPFAAYREVARAPEIPHNALLSDLVLENYQWKSFVRASLSQGEIPLWNPHQFAGIPFLAAGQQSTLYPFSILYYIMPLWSAYGWFTVVQLWLAGAFMYAFARGLQIGRAGAALSGIVYQLSAFFVISAVFPMIIAAAAWLPLILLMIEFIIRQRPALRERPSTIPWVAIGAVALGCNILAGHVEITYYTLIIAAYYAAARLLVDFLRRRAEHALPVRWLVTRGGWLLVMVALGLGLGAVQFVPLFELVSRNFRSGSASFEQVLGWAHPMRDLVQFILPNFYGNPSHHAYFDWFTMQTVPATVNAAGSPITTIDWGIKNYVEGALYLGILPLALSTFALLNHNRAGAKDSRAYRWIFALLALVSLTFMFGLPTYALLFYTLPGIDQLHSPFRWIFAVTLSVAVLSGFGLDDLLRGERRVLARRLSYALAGIGGLALVGLLLSRLFYPQVEPLIDRLFHALALAPNAFTDASMFYSYQFTNVLIFALMSLGAGVVFVLVGRSTRTIPPHEHNAEKSPQNVGATPSLPEFGEGDGGWGASSIRERAVALLPLILVAIDLMIASWGFNPASNPLLLDFTPPAIQWLMQQPGDWRYTTLEDPTQPPIMNANVGMRYGLDDIRGYESIIPKQYVDYMQQLAPQVQLEFNRVAPLYTHDDYNHFGGYHQALDSELFDLLNVRYVMTNKDTFVYFQEWKLVYEDDAVRIWENDSLMPRAYTVPEDAFNTDELTKPPTYTTAELVADTGREKLIAVEIDSPAWLVVSESYFPGWRAFIRPQGAAEDDEQPAGVELVQGNFQGVRLPEAGAYTVRLVYSPQSFQVGAFGSFISGVVLLFLGGVWLWRLYVTPAGETASTASRVAKNSFAPIVLNLFNRGIDFAFAFVMLRILGPEGSGIYYYAVIIFGWFDIFTNFGLNLFLTREVARDRAHARRYFANTSALRLLLAALGVPLLVAFLALRQSTVEPALTAEALLAIALLYVGLVPNSLSTGLSALFYAFERAEVPAAIATVATISKTVFGLAALLAGFGVVGLAGVSILTNLITLAVMAYNGRDMFRGEKPIAETIERPLMRKMVGESWPLMLNHFLASIFFQIDVILIEAMHGNWMVGQYSVAYKWVLALNVIPSFFTQALLPVMARQAHEDRAALKRNYGLAIQLLVSTALPVAVLFTFLAETLTRILGGAEFLPDGAIALQFMIWSIPIGWMNSLTQYVLIALDLQRRITWAFILGVSFNLITNFIFIPQYGYRAAALTTIASEAVLFVPFILLLHSSTGRINWFSLLWRPVAATAAMLTVLLVGWSAQPALALIVSCAVYAGVLIALNPSGARQGWSRIRGRLAARG